MSKGIWEIVTGTETLGKGASRSEETTFKQRSNMALATIMLSISDRFLGPALEIKDPSILWKTLKEQYNALSAASVDAILAQYQALEMKEDESIVEFFSRFTLLETRRTGVGHHVSRPEQMRALLR